MRRRLSSNLLVVVAAALAGLLLTVTRPAPKGLMSLGIGDQAARAAPGQAAGKAARHNLTALKVFNRTLVRVRDNYVDPGRIDPKEMLYSALDSVQFHIPEVLVDTDRDAQSMKIVVNDKVQTFATKDVTSPWRLSGKLKQIFRFIEANMNPGADLAQVEYAAVNGMLNTLDPHSVLLDPEMAREMDVNTSGKFGGLGIVIGIRKHKLTVLRPMKNTPAWAAGVKKADHIVKIDNEVTENLTVSEAADRMRGDPGTKVTLWIERKGEKGLLRVPITRDIIRVPSVESKLLSKNTGYIKLNQFAGRTAREVKGAMSDLKKAGAKAWIIDMRGNPGGLLEQAIQVSDVFLSSGTIVTTVGGGDRDARRASRRGTDNSAPVAVLVNGSSASASEIVAGALKNLERAITIGTTTFGKGSVQILYDNNDGSKLKLTIAEYLTPKDISIQSVGIVPDIDLHRMFVPTENKDAGDQVRIKRQKRRYGEKDLRASLRSKYAKTAMKPDVSLSYLYERKNPDGTPVAKDDDDDEVLDTDEFRMDFEIELARDLLSSVGNPSRKQMIKLAKKKLSQRAAIEEQRLAKALSALGVDWSAAPRGAAKPKLTATFEIEGHKAQIKAGETLKLTGKVTNTGAAPAYRVHARASSDDGVWNNRELVFGKIDPGKTATWTTHIKIPADAIDRLDMVSFELTGDKVKQDAAPLKFRVVSADPPVFGYSHQLIDGGNGDGLVQPKELHKVLVSVKNIGAGISKETTAILRNASGTALTMKKARFLVGELKPGQEKSVEFEFKVAPSVPENKVVLELTVYDAVMRESIVEKLTYKLAPAQAAPQRTSGNVEAVSLAKVYEGASATSNVVATAKRGTVLKSDARTGAWLRVQFADKRTGFVSVSQVKRTKKRVNLKGVTGMLQVTPPKLSLNVNSFEVVGGSYKLSGKAVDDTHVDDVYIYVSNRDAKVANRKVFYKSNRGAKNQAQMKFSHNLKLWPGSNLVTVVARENGDIKSSKSLYLYRADGNKTAEKRP